MKFNRSELLTMLEVMKPALARVGMLEELSHFWFNAASVVAYDGGLGIRRELKTDLDCGLPGRVLLDLLRSSSLESASLDTQNDQAVLTLGRSKIKLASLPGDRRVWPFPAQAPKKTKPITLTEDVLDAFKSVSFLRTSHPTQVVHYGVVVDVADTGIDLYATDSWSVARMSVACKPGTGDMRFVAPWTFLDAIQAILKPGANLYVMDDCLLADGEGALIGSNIMELPDRPDLPQVVKDRTNGLKPIALPKNLKPLIDRAAIVAGKDDPVIILSGKGEELKVTAKYSLGEFDEKVTLEQGMKKAVTAKLDAVRLARGLDMADRFALTEDGLQLYGGDGYVYVVAAK